MSMMRKFRRAIRDAAGRRLLAMQINDGRGATLMPALERIIRGERITDAEITDVFANDDDEDVGAARVALFSGPAIIPGPSRGKGMAFVSARGVALYDLEYQPYCFSTLLLAQTFDQLARNPELDTIVLELDTPGGATTGTPEAGDAIYRAREAGKKVIALVNPLAASAGYWIASQASEIVCVPSGDVGSIGVFMLHMNCAGMLEQMGVEPTFIFAGPHKVEASSYQALSDDAKAYFQAEVDQVYQQFLAAVARGRGVPVAKVEELFGGGRTLMAPNAKKAGMIDRIATIEATFQRLGVPMESTPQGRRRRGEDATPDEQAESDRPDAVFTTVGEGEDAEVRISGAWPMVGRFTHELIAESEHMQLSDDGSTLAITVSNGHAIYDRNAAADDAEWWEGDLRAGATVTEEADPAEGNTADEPRSRRRHLALLSA